MSPPPFQSSDATSSNSVGPAPLGYESAAIPVDPGNVWIAIWTRPRDAVRWVLATDPTRHVLPLILAGAVANALNPLGDRCSSPGELLVFAAIGLVLGTLLGFLFSYVAAPWLLTIVGGWIGGKGDRTALRTAVAYASIPTICTIPLSLVALMLKFAMLMPSDPQGLLVLALRLVLVPIALVGIVVSIWSIVVSVGAVAAAHRFSVWQSIATMLILVLAFGVLVLLIVAAFFVAFLG